MIENRYVKPAEALKALAHPERLRLVDFMCLHPGVTVSELTAHVGLAQSHVSQHLQILKLHGIVVGERQGRSVCYRVKLVPIVAVLRAMDRIDQQGATYNGGEAI